MANDSGFSILNDFGDDSLKNISAPTGGGFVQFEPFQDPSKKDPQNVVNASKYVNETDYYDIMADYLAGTYIPVQMTMDQEYLDAYREAGFGKRYTADDFKAQIEQALGPMPENSTTKKTLQFLSDAFNARTPMIGAAGVFDVLMQATGKYLDRETQRDALELQRQMTVGEMAVKQAMDANENLMAKEADLRLKAMGYNVENMQSHLNFGEDVRLKLLDSDLKKEELKITGAADLLKNLQKTPVLIYTKDGKYYIPTAVQIRPTEDGKDVEYWTPKMVEKDDGTTTMEFSPGLPEGTQNFYIQSSAGMYDPADSASAAAKLTGPSATAYQEAQAEYFGLKNAGNLIEDIIVQNNKSLAAGQGYTVGAQGLIKKLTQGVRLTFMDVLNELQQENGAYLGDSLYQFGLDKLKTQKQLINAEKSGEDVYIDTDFFVPNSMPMTFEKYTKPNGGGKLEEVNFQAGAVSMENIFDPNWYVATLNYNPSFAENKVKENIITYALARGLKSSGRLNVDDIQRAADSVGLYDFTPGIDVITKLSTVLNVIRNAQFNTIEALRFGDNVDLTFINPDIKKDFDLLSKYLEASGGMTSAYETFNQDSGSGTGKMIDGGNPGNTAPLVDDEAEAQAVDINSWTQ